ncbi:hypothetical protein QI633_17550 [Nocardioides sp. QY071]|uniref:hypothetical protein n=1 Tax=Nocardioides sp. QY071 TaxID=3044187 RepID=UPI00249ABBEB|nr:hypothetical protein [Nocardioides sp. QY071]WGY00338.1 hypothetical protein QI633_17550 [Nocardioides sp. QY071]
MRDTDDLAVAVLVGLGSTDGQQDAAGGGGDVGEGERGPLAGPQRGGVAEQDEAQKRAVIGWAGSSLVTMRWISTGVSGLPPVGRAAQGASRAVR